MIPNQDYGQTISSSNIAKGSATIVMNPQMFKILSSQIYSDKVMAVIRETLCNAKDAQVEAGVDTDIELHLPTVLEPSFYIRDYGMGLTEAQVMGTTKKVNRFNPQTGLAEEVEEYTPGLYMSYGESTKTGTNTAIGGFGIGCKSPLAYSESFLVISFQGGVCKTYSVFLEGGEPKVAKLSEKETSEPNGLKVQLAVKHGDSHEFADKTISFLRFFGYGVKVKGRVVTNTPPIATLNTDTYAVYEATSYMEKDKVSVLMGGVLYSVVDPSSRLRAISSGNHLILKFKIGELSVAATREALSEDPQTVSALGKRVDEVVASFYKDVEAQFEKCGNDKQIFDILRQYDMVSYNYGGNEWVTSKPAESLQIKGHPIGDFTKKYDKQVKVCGSAGMRSHLVPHVAERDTCLLVDRVSGYLKTAKMLYKESGEGTILIHELEEATLLKEFFGDIKVLKVSEEYPRLFPKGTPQSSTHVKTSGVFDYKNREVKELDLTTKGWYIPFRGTLCEMSGSHLLTSAGEVKKIMKTLVTAGLYKEDELYFVQRGGLKQVGRTNLKELTTEQLLKDIRASLTQQDQDDLIGKAVEGASFSLFKYFPYLWEEIKEDFPLLEDQEKVLEGVPEAVHIYRLTEAVVVGAEDRIKASYAEMLKEKVRAKEDFSILGKLYTHRLDKEEQLELAEFYKFKKQTKEGVTS